MLDLASDQNDAFSTAQPARPGLGRRISPHFLPLLAGITPRLISMWTAYKVRARRAAERAELRGADFQVWHDLGASRVAEEVGKPPSAQ